MPDKEAKRMMEYLANAYNAEKIRLYEDRRCPREYCMNEYRNELPRERPIPVRDV